MSTYHKQIFAAYYRYKISWAKPKQLKLRQSIEYYRTELKGKLSGLLNLNGKYKKKTIGPRYSITDEENAGVGHLFFSKYMKSDDKRRIGFGYLFRKPVPFIAIVSKKKKWLEIFVLDEPKFDMYLLLDKYEIGDLDEEIQKIKIESEPKINN